MSKAADKSKKGAAPDAEKKAEIIGSASVQKTDMSDEMLAKTIEIIQAAIAAFKMEKDMCDEVKKKMDLAFVGASWHCIIGKHFGLALTHETSYFAFLKTQGYNVCIFRGAE